jgi:DNA-binding NarL/FixJ family response regulator
MRNGDGVNLRLLERSEPVSLLRSSGSACHPAHHRHRDRPVVCVSGLGHEDTLFRDLARRWDAVRFLLVKGDGRGLQRAMDQSPRLVVVAAHLGETLVAALRRRTTPVPPPIVVLTPRSTARERARFIWAGASAYASEPSDLTEIDGLVGMLHEVAAWR